MSWDRLENIKLYKRVENIDNRDTENFLEWLHHEYKEIASTYLLKYFEKEIVYYLLVSAKESVECSLFKIHKYKDKYQITNLTEEFHNLNRIFLNLGLKDLAIEAKELKKYAENKDFIALLEAQKPFIFRLNSFLKMDIQEHVK